VDGESAILVAAELVGDCGQQPMDSRWTCGGWELLVKGGGDDDNAGVDLGKAA
jgi:hypothetical protein